MAKHGKYVDGIEVITLLDGTTVRRKHTGVTIFIVSPLGHKLVWDIYSYKKLKPIIELLDKTAIRREE